jgi:hypothetical protein
MSASTSAPQPAGDDAVTHTESFDATAARELLARTAELPATKRELLDVLSEYRAAVFAFAFQEGRT